MLCMFHTDALQLLDRERLQRSLSHEKRLDSCAWLQEKCKRICCAVPSPAVVVVCVVMLPALPQFTDRAKTV